MIMEILIMKALVDNKLCTGCGLCVYTCPRVFKMDNYIAKVTKNSITFENYFLCKDAVEQCPSEAIKIIE